MALFGKKKTQDQDQSDKKQKAASQKTVDTSMAELYKEKPATATAKSKEARGGLDSASVGRILVRPLVTEKATNLAADNKYVFVVSVAANKISVARAIQAAYGVKPKKVNIVNLKGKVVNRGRVSGQRNDWRKAIVTLAKGETINIYEGV